MGQKQCIAWHMLICARLQGQGQLLRVKTVLRGHGMPQQDHASASQLQAFEDSEGDQEPAGQVSTSPTRWVSVVMTEMLCRLYTAAAG